MKPPIQVPNTACTYIDCLMVVALCLLPSYDGQEPRIVQRAVRKHDMDLEGCLAFSGPHTYASPCINIDKVGIRCSPVVTV